MAEHREGVGDPERALEILGRLAEETGHPGYHARAAGIARKLGRAEAATAHTTAARAAFERAIEEGEIYTLEGLANLLLDAGNEPQRALDLAEQNAEWKRDASALRTLERAREAVARATGSAGPP